MNTNAGFWRRRARAVALTVLSAGLWCWGAGWNPAAAEDLSESDRQLLIERLEKLREAVESRSKGRIAVAVAAFRGALGSDSAALDLYLKCVEKVDFEDQHRKGQDYRDWKRRQDGRLGDPGFALALRHQLHWLVLTLEAAEKPERIPDLAPRAAKAIEAIFLDAKKLAGQQPVLRQPVLGTVYARAYNVGGIDAEGWPEQPLALAQVFEKVLLPPLRKPSRLAELRETWLLRIKYESMMREGWADLEENNGNGNGGRIGMKAALRPPAFEKFLAEEVPDMRWQMEEDLYKAGDQRAAALRMLDHLDKYLAHPRAEEWTNRFVSLLESKPADKPVPTIADPGPDLAPVETPAPAPSAPPQKTP